MPPTLTQRVLPAAIVAALWTTPLHAQTEAAAPLDRLRFAELTLGLDGLVLPATTTLAAAGAGARTVSVPARVMPRLTLGGTHFWGWAEFYLAFPIPAAAIGSRGPTDARWSSNVETGARVYSGPLTAGTVRPFAAIALGRASVREQRAAGTGPTVTSLRPLPSIGASWAVGRVIVEGGLQWLGGGTLPSPIDRQTAGAFAIPQTAFWFGAKRRLETTNNAEMRARLAGESGGKALLRREGVPGGAFIGIGPTAAWALTASTHNVPVSPRLPERDPNARAIDFAAGWHFKSARLSLALPYRRFTSRNEGFGLAQSRRRDAIGIEALRFIGDYTGFVPFVGAGVSGERYTVTEQNGSQTATRWSRAHLAPTVVVGWDIRPTRQDRIVLRTNLRYTPGASLDIPARGRVQLPAFEFNFIQLIWHI